MNNSLHLMNRKWNQSKKSNIYDHIEYNKLIDYHNPFLFKLLNIHLTKVEILL